MNFARAVAQFDLQTRRIKMKELAAVAQVNKTGIVVMLQRAANGGIGLGFNRATKGEVCGPFVITKLVPASVSEHCKQLEVGDELHAVDGQSVHTLTMKQATNLINGQAGHDDD
jgi:C-terminal processing protease CtpA/Prc